MKLNKELFDKSLNIITGASLIILLLLSMTGCHNLLAQKENINLNLVDMNTQCEYSYIDGELTPKLDKNKNHKGCN